jgi:hypothetical protein
MHKELESIGLEAAEASVNILPQNNPVITKEPHKNFRSVSDLVGDI